MVRISELRTRDRVALVFGAYLYSKAAVYYRMVYRTWLGTAMVVERDVAGCGMSGRR